MRNFNDYFPEQDETFDKEAWAKEKQATPAMLKITNLFTNVTELWNLLCRFPTALWSANTITRTRNAQ